MVPDAVAVASGPSKRRAIATALASGLIDTLVTDVSTAHNPHDVANNRATHHQRKMPSVTNPDEEEAS